MSLQFHSKVFLIAGRSIQAHSPEGQDLVDRPTHSTCRYQDFHLCSMTKLKNTAEKSARLPAVPWQFCEEMVEWKS